MTLTLFCFQPPLKLILSDVLAFNLEYDLLYQREFLPPPTEWSVARGLNTPADLRNCERKRAPPKAGPPDGGRLLGAAETPLGQGIKK